VNLLCEAVEYDEEKEREAEWKAKKRLLARMEVEMYSETECEAETGLYFSHCDSGQMHRPELCAF